MNSIKATFLPFHLVSAGLGIFWGSTAPGVSATLTGQARFDRLREAVDAGKVTPPVDLRFLQSERPKEIDVSSSTSKIVSYLETLYTSVAETLPDHREELADPGDACVMYSLDSMPDDPYAKFVDIQRQLSLHQDMAGGAASSKAKVRKPRKKVKGAALDLNPDKADMEERYLPPGRMMDYYQQFVATLDDESKISFVQFWRVWCSNYSHMKFRSTSSHSVCSVCTRYKLMIRELSGHLNARKKQAELYSEHLRSQYLDRALYWERRGVSRLGSMGEITVIIDSMDQQKFTYPRSDLYRAKDLSTLQRPRAHVTAVIAHGHFVLIAVSDHDMPKNSNCMCEILGHVWSRLRMNGIDTTRLRFRVQRDNTSRECKNNIVLAFLASLTARGLAAGTTLSCLRSGHSHEDVDQMFGKLAGWMSSNGRYARHPDDFMQLIRQWLCELKRPYEKDRYCIKVDQLRDW